MFWWVGEKARFPETEEVVMRISRRRYIRHDQKIGLERLDKGKDAKWGPTQKKKVK